MNKVKTDNISKKSEVKREKKPMKPALKAVLIAFGVIAGIIVIIAVVAPVSEAYLYLHPQKNEVLSTWPDDEQIGLYYDSYRIPLSDGSKLSAWYIPAQEPDDGSSTEFSYIDSGKLVIFSHNYGSNRCGEGVNAMWIAEALSHAGHNVLTFDYSGSGKSVGSGYMLGAREKNELAQVIDFAHNNDTIDCSEGITLFGWGYGAASALMAGADKQCVVAVISDSSYDDLDSYLSEHGDIWSSLPSWCNGLFKDLCSLLAGDTDLFEDSPLQAVRRSEGRHFLFIHSSSDNIIPQSCSQALSSAAAENNESDIWIAQGAEHLEAYIEQGENYISRVLDFLDDVYAPASVQTAQE